MVSVVMVSSSSFAYSMGIDSSSLNACKVIAIELSQNKRLTARSLYVPAVSLRRTECVDVHYNRVSGKKH